MTLSIEQVPKYREVMQAMTMVSQFLASTLAASIGGLILVLFNFNWLALLGVSTIVGGGIFQFFPTDPIKRAKGRWKNGYMEHSQMERLT